MNSQRWSLPLFVLCMFACVLSVGCSKKDTGEQQPAAQAEKVASEPKEKTAQERSEKPVKATEKTAPSNSLEADEPIIESKTGGGKFGKPDMTIEQYMLGGKKEKELKVTLHTRVNKASISYTGTYKIIKHEPRSLGNFSKVYPEETILELASHQQSGAPYRSSNRGFYQIADKEYRLVAWEDETIPEPSVLEKGDWMVFMKQPFYKGETWKVESTTTATIEDDDVTLTVPVGTFEHCLKIKYVDTNGSDQHGLLSTQKGKVRGKSTVYTWYCPRVGYAKYHETFEAFGGRSGYVWAEELTSQK